MIALTWAAAIVAVIPLVLMLAQLLLNGLGQLTPTFFTQLPSPPGVHGGGVANAIVGSIVLVAVAMTMAVPIGIAAGLFLAEHRHGRFAQTVRLLADVLSGLPSIVLGIFAWEVIVRPSGHFSAWSGGIALGLLVLPLIARATEEMVRLVPIALTEAALALGFSRWQTAMTVVLRTAMPGIVTAILLAMSRAAGETAPLLFTAFGNQFWSVDPARPIAALPLQIYTYALSPYDEWRAQAWASALVLLMLVTIISVAARAVVRTRAKLLSTVTVRVERSDA